jgi:hypothetical protein
MRSKSYESNETIKEESIDDQTTMSEKTQWRVHLKRVKTKIIWACEEKHHEQCDVDHSSWASVSFDNKRQ